jgi:hypothetical protein
MQTETVTRLRAGTTTDPYSNEPTEDWTTPTELDITTLAPAEPRPSGEPLQDARNQVVSGYTLYLPEGSDVTRVDRMRVRGVVHNVLGDPAVWLGAGLVVQLERSEG